MSEKPTEGSYLMEGVQELFRTRGPRHHFFGYYDKSPFDADGRRILCHTVDFTGRMVEEKDKAEIGVWDIQTGKYEKVAETSSFNWQQGSMLQWMPPDYSQRIIYNDCIDGEFRAVIVHLATGERRLMASTIYSVDSNGKYAITPNFRRLYFCRPGYSYLNICDPKWNKKVPDKDGIHLVDLEKGEEHLIVTTRQIVDNEHLASMDEGDNYLEHMMFNPGSDRFVFMHRWQIADGGIATRLYAAGRQGDNIHLFQDSLSYGHGCWRNDREYLIFGRMVGGFSKLRHCRGLLRFMLRPALRLNRALPHTKTLMRIHNKVAANAFLLLHDGRREATMVDQRHLWDDGHCSVRVGNPNHVLLDTYPDANCRQKLMVYDMGRKTVVELADLFCPKKYHAKGYRCDLHQRWDRTGARVCVDSLQDGTRQMYVYDVAKALRKLD